MFEFCDFLSAHTYLNNETSGEIEISKITYRKITVYLESKSIPFTRVGVRVDFQIFRVLD